MAISWNFRHILWPESSQSISRILQSLNLAQTWRYHKRHHSSGYVWQGWFQNPVIQDNARLPTVPRYMQAKPPLGRNLVQSTSVLSDGSAMCDRKN